jgi:hypothetical protein
MKELKLFEQVLFDTLVEQEKPEVLQSYARRVLKSESDIKTLEVYTKRLGEGNHYLVVKVNGKDVYFTKVNYDELTKNDASFKAVADKLLKDFYKSIGFSKDTFKYEIEKYKTAAKVS